MKNIEALKFPIGKFNFDSNKDLGSCIASIEALPSSLKTLLKNKEESSLRWPYRPGGWQLCQLIHHIADSHMNAYIRMRMAYTNPGKSIAPYDERAWSELPDAMNTDVSDSLAIIFAVHQKWVTFLQFLRKEDLDKTYFHPSDKVHVSLKEAIQMYAWHGDHHFAHLIQGFNSEGKYSLSKNQ